MSYGWVFKNRVLRRVRRPVSFGQTDRPIPIQATRILAGKDGGPPTFGDEYPNDDSLTVSFVPRTSEDDGGDWRRFRMEVKTEDKALKGYFIVVAALPYRTRLAFAAQFRSATHKKPEFLRTAEARVEAAFEPYETGTRLTAAIDEPASADVDVDALDDFEGYTFGLVPDLSRSIEAVRDTLPGNAQNSQLDSTVALQLLAGPGDLQRDGGWGGASVGDLWSALS